MIGRTNAGFRVERFTTVRRLADVEGGVVLAHKEETGEWVTWCYNGQTDGFFWGHYFTDKDEALTDYIDRVRQHR